MKFKGLDALRNHVPDLARPGGLWLAIGAILGVFAITSAFFWLVDLYFIEWLPDGEIVVLALGFLIFSQFFTRKTIYKQKFGELAYRNAFARFGVAGLGIVSASLAHLGYIAGPEIPPVWWRPILITLGILLVTTGILLWIRSVLVFGLDNLAMLYVYHPEEGRLVDTSIYNIVRHPVYSAALDIGIGLALIHANWYALLVALLLPLFFAGWVRLWEEKDLLERYPEYAEYRKRVPAFWARPVDLAGFYRFLITGK